MPELYYMLEKRFCPGDTVDVYYNPERPEWSYLVFQSNKNAATAMLWFAADFAVLCSILLGAAFKS